MQVHYNEKHGVVNAARVIVTFCTPHIARAFFWMKNERIFADQLGCTNIVVSCANDTFQAEFKLQAFRVQVETGKCMSPSLAKHIESVMTYPDNNFKDIRVRAILETPPVIDERDAWMHYTPRS